MLRSAVFLLLAGAICIAFCATDEEDFQAFVTTYNKKYKDLNEISQRFEIFKANKVRIAQLNQQAAGRTQFAINKFADLTKEEFKASKMSKVSAKRNPEMPVADDMNVQAIPDSFDWRDKGAVTGVKDQGQCGSCWAFSATGNMEGQWFLAGHTLTSLSEQNLVDCDHECMTYEGEQSCDAGCDGGLQPNAYHYVIATGGIDTESSYQYEGYDDTCRFSAASVGAKFSNWTMISQDEDQMAAYLVANGPIAIAADAEEWQFYFGGVFYIPCGTELDHGILIVGYGTETDIFDQTMPFWIIKNSWGADWGESGYIRVERGAGLCGLNLFASSIKI